MKALIRIPIIVAVSMFAITAHAQDKGFPERPITIIVGYPAGGGQDIWSRTLATSMSKTLGQPVVVQNKVGASGSIGLSYVANAKPDGYTIGTVQASALLLAALTMKIDYKANDFDYLAGSADQAYCICVAAKSPFKTLDDLQKYDQGAPGKLSYGHLGAGHITYVFADATFRHLGMSPVGIPYKGDAETIPAVLGGHIDVASTASTFAPLAASGELRPLAIFASKRMAQLPDVPTIAEFGVPLDAKLTSFIGYVAPKGLPAEVRAKLENALEIAIKGKDFEELLKKNASSVLYRDGAAFGKEALELEKMVQNLPKPAQ